MNSVDITTLINYRSNPGGLRVSKQEAVDGGISDPRNETLLKMLSMINYGERAGSGMNGIFMVWEKVYGCKPTFDEQIGVDRMVLTLDTQGKEPNMDALISLYGMDYHGMTDNKQATTDDKQATADGKPAINAGTDDNPTVNEGKQGIKDELSLATRDEMDHKPTINAESDDKRARIINFLSSNGVSRTSEIAEMLNLGLTQTKYYLKKMTEDKLITPHGANKNRTYSLKK